MDSLLDNPLADLGGLSTVLASITMQILSLLKIAEINPYITFFTAVAGFVYLVFKIKNIRLNNKILEKKLEDNDVEEDS